MFCEKMKKMKNFLQRNTLDKNYDDECRREDDESEYENNDNNNKNNTKQC